MLPRTVLPLVLVLLSAVLAGCANSGLHEHYQLLVAASHGEPEQAWLDDDRLLLATRGDDGERHYLYAELVPAGDDFSHQDATLALTGRASPEPDSLAVPVQPTANWQRLLDGLLAKLVPQAPGQAVVFFVNDQEKVVWRNGERYAVADYADRPADVDVVRRLDDQAFTEILFTFLADYARQQGLDARRTLFVNPDTSRGAMGWLYVDLDRHQVLTLRRPWQAGMEQVGEAPALQGVGDFNSILIKSQAITLLKNPFTWFGRLAGWTVSTTATLLESPVPFGAPDVPPLYQGEGMDLAEWEDDLDRFWAPDRYRGSIQFLIDGDQYFPRLLDAIRDAEERVLMRTYIFDNDDYAVTVADALRARGANDADVRVLFDDLGSRLAWRAQPATAPAPGFEPPAHIGDYLAADEAVRFRAAPNPWLTGDHVKSTVIDDGLAFVGGMNVGREYRSEWHDLMMEVRGPVVQRLARDFHRANAHAGPGGDFAYIGVGLFQPVRDLVDDGPEDQGQYIDIRPLYTRTFNAAIHRAQLRAIDRAKRYIYIQNSYFSDDRIQKALIQARRRGVDVRVILPTRGNHGIMNANNAVVVNRFLEHGIRVYAYPGMSHVKAAIYDGWACLSSANFDKLSLRVNQELNLAFSDPETVARLKRDLFEVDFERSREVTEPVDVGISDYFAEILANQL